MPTPQELILLAKFRALKGEARQMADALLDSGQEALLISLLRGDPHHFLVVVTAEGPKQLPLTRGQFFVRDTSLGVVNETQQPISTYAEFLCECREDFCAGVCLTFLIPVDLISSRPDSFGEFGLC